MIGPKGENLIFLVSQPRAGSTLLQLMLAGHPEIATTSEPWIALHPLYALRETGISTEYDHAKALDATMGFLGQIGAGREFYTKQVSDFLLSFYRRALGYQKKSVFLDKTPRYYHVIPELVEVFPEAKLIILIRNPLAVLNSILKTWVKEDLELLGCYKEDLLTAPKSLVEALSRFSDRTIRVCYEELVTDPEPILKGLCAFLALEYTDKLLDYTGRADPGWAYGDAVGVHRASSPIADSLDTWKKGLAMPQYASLAQEYLDRLGPGLIKELGYDFKALRGDLTAPAAGARKGLVTLDGAMRLNNIEVEAHLLRRSLSWRVTAPLRAISKLLGR